MAADAARVQHGLYRRMSAGRKLTLVLGMYDTGRRLALAGLRLRNPAASEEELWRLWAQEHLGPELFESVYGEASDE